MSYSALERVEDALKGKPRDRVPVFPFIGAWVATHFSDFPPPEVSRDPKLIVDAQIKARESMGYDPIYNYIDPLYIPEAFGCRVRYLETGPLVDPIPITITRLEDIDEIPQPDIKKEGRLPLILEATRKLSDYGGNKIPVVGMFEGPFTNTGRIIDIGLIMRMVFKNREALEKLLDKVTGFLRDFGKALIENGANMLFIPEPTASATMISPKLFHQMVLPRLQRLFSELEVPCILHICGDTAPLLEYMEQTGAAILSLDQCMNLSEARKSLPDAVLGGNVDPISSLMMGTEEQVVDDALNCLRTGGTSRFFLMPGCAVPPHTPKENLKAMIQTAIEYGV